MIFKCEKCNNELNLMKEAKYCPLCGSEIEKVNLDEKVVALYNSGKSIKDIEAELHVSTIAIDQIISKAAVNGDISTAGLIQTEYADDIQAVINNDWDGKLKTIKAKVPEDCTYVTINYYVRKARRSAAEERHRSNEEKALEVRKMIRSGKDMETILKETGSSIYMAERILVEEIKKDKAVANPYINNEYKSKILDIVNDPAWDGKLKTVKDQLPDEVTYTAIKATIEKNK